MSLSTDTQGQSIDQLASQVQSFQPLTTQYDPSHQISPARRGGYNTRTVETPRSSRNASVTVRHGFNGEKSAHSSVRITSPKKTNIPSNSLGKVHPISTDIKYKDPSSVRSLISPSNKSKKVKETDLSASSTSETSIRRGRQSSFYQNNTNKSQKDRSIMMKSPDNAPKVGLEASASRFGRPSQASIISPTHGSTRR